MGPALHMRCDVWMVALLDSGDFFSPRSIGIAEKIFGRGISLTWSFVSTSSRWGWKFVGICKIPRPRRRGNQNDENGQELTTCTNV